MQQLTPDVFVNTSLLWETNTGIIHGPEGAILIDPGIFDPEFEAIAAQAGPVAAGFATHAHWDHILWHRVLGENVPRFATSETIAFIQKDRDRILNNLANTETEIRQRGHTNETGLWDRSQLFKEQPIRWGTGAIAGVNVDALHVPGHADGQAALVLPDHGVAFVADTLSDIETPSVNGGSRDVALYLQTLDRLQTIIDRVEWIVPGHGKPARKKEAQRRLDADRRYLSALQSFVDASSLNEEVDALARQMLVELDENRAQSELAWSMHLDNVQQLVTERELLESGLPVRKSSRLILLDSTHSVWMLRIDDPIRPRWILPGGGVEEGESPEDAARRELWEECSIDDTEIGPLVATRHRLESRSGSSYLASEQYFLVRVNEKQPDIANMLDYEMADYTRQKWLSAEDIRASNELVYPLGLADLLDTLAEGHVPSNPWSWSD